MIQAGSKMVPLWSLVLVKICFFTAGCGIAMGAPTASKSDCYRKTCMDIEYDIQNATCCENQLHQGEGLSCCGGQAFNPEEATCCKVEDGHKITVGLSEKVSVCCGLKAYNQLNEMCCQSTVVAKPVPKAECCGTKAYDEDTHLCCGKDKKVQEKKSRDALCCGGDDQFDTRTECCCDKTLTTQLINSSCCQEESALCGTEAYNKFHQQCYQLTVVDKPALNAQRCGKRAYDEDTHLCCGKDKKVQEKKSRDALCCGGDDQFDTRTECCCDKTLTAQLINSSCCQEESGMRQKPAPQPTCTEPRTSLCGSSCYNPRNFSCCERNQGKSKRCCATGQCADVAPALYNPHTHVCCDGYVSEWKPRKDEPHGQHCCGTDVYWPHTEICCDGHRHHKKENTHCCGVKAYNIKDTRKKCCAGTLYNLNSGHEAQCCGSILLTPSNQNVCCSSEYMEVLYSAKTGFGCCGHLYYNASLWSCCAGKLTLVHQPGQHQNKAFKESRHRSVNNLNEADLCEEMQIGIVESVSPHVVFSSVLKINGRNATVTPLASPHILKIPHHCSSPKLTPGKTYFFNNDDVFTDFNHDSIPQSLHFIISKCCRPVTTTN